MAITATAATEMVTTAYSSTKFHQVLDLVPSNDEFKSRGGPQFVYDICRPLLRKHGLTSVFGVGLVHRHFDIDSDQKLVEFNNITLPWRTTTMTTAGGEDVEAKIHILPTAWMFDDQEQKWMPYEFSYSPMGKVEPVRLDDARYRDFLAEYACALKDAGLQKVVGLRLWPGEGFRGGLERTEGKANIWLVPGQYSPADARRGTETMWFFQPDFEHHRCRCHCIYRDNGWHTNEHAGVSSGQGMSV